MTATLAHFEISDPDDQTLVASHHHLMGWPPTAKDPVARWSTPRADRPV